MELCRKFTADEDEFLIVNYLVMQVSRMAFRLQRPYGMVQMRLVMLGLRTEKELNMNGKFMFSDEIDYNLLMDGNSEEEIQKIRGSRTVLSGYKSHSSFSDDE